MDGLFCVHLRNLRMDLVVKLDFDMRKLAILLAVTASTNLYAAITGTVFDADAKPLAGATIRAYTP
jgi:hypothetical protein